MRIDTSTVFRLVFGPPLGELPLNEQLSTCIPIRFSPKAQEAKHKSARDRSDRLAERTALAKLNDMLSEFDIKLTKSDIKDLKEEQYDSGD